MPAFSLAQRLKAGETVFSGWCMMGSPIVAETIAREGFAAVVLDAQHGLWDTSTLREGIGAVHHGGAAPFVRVPLSDFGMVSRALDFGAEGIVAPMINTADDARQFAAAAKYPPVGERSFGPPRATMLQGAMPPVQYLAAANAGTLTFAMIETPQALANVEAIAATPGIDALFIGPYDLATSLSNGKAQDINAAEVDAAIDRICAAAIKAGKIPGIYCRDAARALDLAKRGFRFMTVGSDFSLVREGASSALKQLPVKASGSRDAF
jgi:4-hydroxy-2-oxoheptanedioate aldolase